MIRNKTKKTIVSHEVRICRTAASQARGLMLSRKNDRLGVVFIFRAPKQVSLHMVLVFYPIDVLFLDEKMRVTESKENLRPFSFYSSKKKAKYVIELPRGRIRESRTAVGDILKIDGI